MSIKKLLIFSISCFVQQLVHGQTVFWQDNFENATTPEVAAGSVRTPTNNGGTGGPPNTSYFKRASTADISTNLPYTGFTNTFFWAGEDHDTPFGATAGEQQIVWTGINISGKTGITFKGFFAANSQSGSWDNFTTGSGATGYGMFPGTTASNDYIIVEYAIDAGAYTKLVSFFGDDITGPIGTAKRLKEDTNNDFIGDGTILTVAMQEITKTIPGTGTTMKLRIRVFSNGGNEEWSIDNFRLTNATTLPVNWISSNASLNNHQQAVINWKVNETQVTGYEVEKSLPGGHFFSIASIPGKGDGTHQYIFTEPAVLAGEALYRIKQNDLSGRISYSPVLRLRPASANSVRLFPNPVQSYVTVSAGTALVNTSFSISNSAGIVVTTGTLTGNSTSINVEQLPPGIYTLSFANGERQKMVKR